MKIEVSEDYESLAAEYQYSMIAILDEVLKRNNVSLSDRKSICGEFAFDFGILHDQGEIKSGKRTFSPLAAFIEGNSLFIRNEVFEFHEYAFGNVSEYFDGNGT